MSEENIIDSTSPSVQTHLGIIQGTIQRMAANSASSKTWCITIVSAMLVIIADKGKPEFAWIAFIPTFFFMCLDAYYLALEKGFRDSYNQFVEKLHLGQLKPEDLYAVDTDGCQSKHQLASFKSFSVWGFYVGLFILIALAKVVVLG